MVITVFISNVVAVPARVSASTSILLKQRWLSGSALTLGIVLASIAAAGSASAQPPQLLNP
ncbi:hypothetical protein ACQ5SK_27430 [Bradyrhizobium japonicum]